MKQNLLALIKGEVKVSTKVLFGLFLALPLLMQNDASKNFVTPILSMHPKIAAAVGSLVSISVLLHNPQVQTILGIKTGE